MMSETECNTDEFLLSLQSGHTIGGLWFHNIGQNISLQYRTEKGDRAGLN